MRYGMSIVIPALIMAVPAAAQTKADAEAMVKRGIAFAKTAGVEKALQEITNPGGQFKNGELYLFVYDLTGKVMAHGANPKMVGKDLIKFQDSDGKFYISELINIGKTKGSGWLSFRFPNPVTHQVEPKIAYVELSNGLVYGSGIYVK